MCCEWVIVHCCAVWCACVWCLTLKCIEWLVIVLGTLILCLCTDAQCFLSVASPCACKLSDITPNAFYVYSMCKHCDAED